MANLTKELVAKKACANALQPKKLIIDQLNSCGAIIYIICVNILSTFDTFIDKHKDKPKGREGGRRPSRSRLLRPAGREHFAFRAGLAAPNAPYQRYYGNLL
ncbi:hypothetical protein ACJJTC_016748 [Scirpophaga incertulas]